MDEELKQLKASLARRKCPPRVQAEVDRRVATDLARFRPGRRRSFFALAAVAAVVALALGVAFRPDRSPVETVAASGPAPVEPHVVVAEAGLAFAAFGDAFQQAVARGEPILRKRAVEPLRDQFLTVRNRFTDPL
jgi:hypothetical protein